MSKDSAMLPYGMRTYADWTVLGEEELGAKRALTLVVHNAQMVFCTLHLFLADENGPVDHKALSRFCSLHAAAALQKRTELAAKARGMVLEDIYPQHIAEMLTKEAARRERRMSALPKSTAPVGHPVGSFVSYTSAPGRNGSTSGGSHSNQPSNLSVIATTSGTDSSTEDAGNDSPGAAARRQYRATLTEIHPSASLLFCDIVSYTSISRSLMNPELTMAMLHSLYCEFDKVCEGMSDKIEKVDVIGDCFMAASGLNYQKDEKSAVHIIRFAVEVLRKVANMPPMPVAVGTTVKFQVRIGINSGGVASGVLGSLKRKFTLMGDTGKDRGKKTFVVEMYASFG